MALMSDKCRSYGNLAHVLDSHLHDITYLNEQDLFYKMYLLNDQCVDSPLKLSIITVLSCSSMFIVNVWHMILSSILTICQVHIDIN